MQIVLLLAQTMGATAMIEVGVRIGVFTDPNTRSATCDVERLKLWGDYLVAEG